MAHVNLVEVLEQNNTAFRAANRMASRPGASHYGVATLNGAIARRAESTCRR
jgi:hypothetical protein